MRKHLSIQFSEEFKEHINERKKNWPIKNPIAAILFASVDECEEELMLMFYDRDNLPSVDGLRIFNCDGIEFIVPQMQIHDDLDGRVLDIRNGKIVVID